MFASIAREIQVSGKMPTCIDPNDVGISAPIVLPAHLPSPTAGTHAPSSIDQILKQGQNIVNDLADVLTSYQGKFDGLMRALILKGFDTSDREVVSLRKCEEFVGKAHDIRQVANGLSDRHSVTIGNSFQFNSVPEPVTRPTGSRVRKRLWIIGLAVIVLIAWSKGWITIGG